jgi:hypothetical protein
MTHTEAAAKSPEGLAIRYDGEDHVSVIFSPEAGKLFRARDHVGEEWDEFDLAEADAYHDWEPVPKPPLRIRALNMLDSVRDRVFPRGDHADAKN